MIQARRSPRLESEFVPDQIAASQQMYPVGMERSAVSERQHLATLPKLSMSEMTTYRWSLLEEVAAYTVAGIDAIGIWRPKLAEFGEERGSLLVRESPLAVSSVSWAGGFTGSHGHSYREAIDDARDAIRVAGEMNAECLVIVSGSRAGHTVNHARRLLVDALDELGDFAAANKLVLALQPMHPMFEMEWTFLTALEQTLDVIERCRHDSVRLAFDVYHLWQSPRLLERIPEIAPLTQIVQLSDWREPPRSDNDRCPLGEGEIPLAEIARAFVDADYNGYFEIGIWSEEVWSSDYVELLNRCRTQFERLFGR